MTVAKARAYQCSLCLMQTLNKLNNQDESNKRRSKDFPFIGFCKKTFPGLAKAQ